MAQPSAVKNWEAQQRTNTVLAQSIKQLKDDFVSDPWAISFREIHLCQMDSMSLGSFSSNVGFISLGTGCCRSR